MVIQSQPENGYRSISTVNTDFISMSGISLSALPDEIQALAGLYAPLDGLNEMGLAVSVNMIQDSVAIEQNTDKPDITTTTAIRLLLDKAANVEEAIELLGSYDMHASFGYMVHFAIADRTGNSIVVELVVRFGDDGDPFIMHLYDNDTAKAIGRHVGTADWRLPIYNYEGYENWEVMQYYDIPSRYEIPSNPETVTEEAAGTVYYSEPNRIVLFYGDGEVTGEYTPVGYFDNTEEFRSAVENNPVLEGWGNKIVHISNGE